MLVIVQQKCDNGKSVIFCANRCPKCYRSKRESEPREKIKKRSVADAGIGPELLQSEQHYPFWFPYQLVASRLKLRFDPK